MEKRVNLCQSKKLAIFCFFSILSSLIKLVAIYFTWLQSTKRFLRFLFLIWVAGCHIMAHFFILRLALSIELTAGPPLYYQPLAPLAPLSRALRLTAPAHRSSWTSRRCGPRCSRSFGRNVSASSLASAWLDLSAPTRCRHCPNAVVCQVLVLPFFLSSILLAGKLFKINY